jgi:hypothetical protein
MLRDSKRCFGRLSPAARALTVGAVLVGGLLAAGLRGPGSLVPPSVAAEAAAAGPGTAVAASRIDLRYLPVDAQLFAVARPAAIFQRPELSEYGKLLSEDRGSPWISVTELEQVTFVIMSLPEKLDPGPRDRLVIYQTVKPFAFREHLRHLPPTTEKEHAGKKYLLHVERGFEVAVCRPDDRTLVEADSEETMKVFLTAAKGIPRFVDRALWEQFQADHLLAAVRADVIEKILKLEPAPAVAPFAPLWRDTSWGLGGIRAGEETTFHGLAVARNDAGAEQVVRTLEAARVLAINAVKQGQATAKQQPVSAAEAFLVWAAAGDVGERLLNQAQIEREGTVVRVRTAAVLARLVTNIFPNIVEAREGARRSMSMNNLKQIALAMHNYHDIYRHLPSALLYGPDGKTPYSWRVALLPFLEQKRLYDQYRFDEPWDGPNNRRVLEKMPAVYRCPKEPAASQNASYFLLVGPGAIFHGDHPPQFSEIRDGTANTLLAVEAKREIPWTKPEDIAFDPDKPLPKLGGFFAEGCPAATADGAVHFLPQDMDEKLLRLMITAADGQPMPPIPDVRRRPAGAGRAP